MNTKNVFKLVESDKLKTKISFFIFKYILGNTLLDINYKNVIYFIFEHFLIYFNEI